MKKMLRNVMLFGCSMAIVPLVAQTRYKDDVFTRAEIKTTADVTYGINFNEYAPQNIGGPQLLPLMCDIYEPDPSVDTVSARPVMIYFHTGSFLPKGLVSPMGDRKDSAAVEICKRFAQKGYVAISAGYRVGWLANSTNLDLRRGTNLLAVYKSIQDAKAAVRWVRQTEDADGNPYKVDPDKIVLVGQGSGGYSVLAYATLDKYAEATSLAKFQYDASGTGLYGDPVNAGDPYIDTSIVGDWDGYGGVVTLTGNNTPLGLPEVDMTATGRNFINHPGYSNEVDMVMNLGGALGDSTWLEAGDAPMASAHCRYDFFAPYYEGMVQVPVGQQFFPVVEVAGSHTTIRLANELGNNDSLIMANFQDPISVMARSNVHNLGNEENILTFNMTPPNPQLPFRVNSNPWDFWDPSDPNGSNETNPNIRAQSLAYIDTVMLFFSTRASAELYGTIGLEENPLAGAMHLYPNPTSGKLYIDLRNEDVTVERLKVLDATGKKIREVALDVNKPEIDLSDMKTGVYFLRVETNKGPATKRILKQ